jgi:hypothetical protein
MQKTSTKIKNEKSIALSHRAKSIDATSGLQLCDSTGASSTIYLSHMNCRRAAVAAHLDAAFEQNS